MAGLVERLCAPPLPAAGWTELPLTFLGPTVEDGDIGSLGPYRVQGVLGCGGMGVVLQAFDQALQRTVAIKVLRPDQSTEKNRLRFTREGQTAAGIKHENVVTVFSVGSLPSGLPYLVMEYVSGTSLLHRIQTLGRLSTGLAAQIALQVAEGLGAIHIAGLIHRDIKPANIILEQPLELISQATLVASEAGSDGLRVKIVDFGLAKNAGTHAGLTRERVAGGTVEYISPEQVNNTSSADARSDIYSLGTTMYEALTGELPFRGAPHMIVQQLLRDEPIAPRRMNDTIPRDLETILLRCIEKDPRGATPTDRNWPKIYGGSCAGNQ